MRIVGLFTFQKWERNNRNVGVRGKETFWVFDVWFEIRRSTDFKIGWEKVCLYRSTTRKVTGFSFELFTSPLTKRATPKYLQLHVRAWFRADFRQWSFPDDMFGFAVTGARQARLHSWNQTRSYACAWKAWKRFFSLSCISIWKPCSGISFLIAVSSGRCPSFSTSYWICAQIFSSPGVEKSVA